MEANKQANKDVEVQELLHESEDLSNKAIHQKLNELYLQRLSGEKYKRQLWPKTTTRKCTSS